MGHQRNQLRRMKRRKARGQHQQQPQRRAPHGVVPVDRIGGGDPDSEFVHDDDWLTPYEPTEEVL